MCKVNKKYPDKRSQVILSDAERPTLSRITIVFDLKDHFGDPGQVSVAVNFHARQPGGGGL
ncbi:hypothetical protein ACNY9Y_003362 [Cronobacter dublinensis]